MVTRSFPALKRTRKNKGAVSEHSLRRRAMRRTKSLRRSLNTRRRTSFGQYVQNARRCLYRGGRVIGVGRNHIGRGRAFGMSARAAPLTWTALATILVVITFNDAALARSPMTLPPVPPAMTLGVGRYSPAPVCHADFPRCAIFRSCCDRRQPGWKKKWPRIASEPFLTNGAAGRNRTHDPLVRSQVLYPAELQPPEAWIIPEHARIEK
jgi:hypothetical protein